jgi:hypothetical protein
VVLGNCWKVSFGNFCVNCDSFVAEVGHAAGEIMEEAREKLKVLMKKARKEKIDLSGLKAVRKRESFFSYGRKTKVFGVLVVLVVLHGATEHLLFTKNVRKVLNFPAKSLKLQTISVLDLHAERP